MEERNQTAQTRDVYIVLSQTGTLLSRILKWVTHAEYNHSSISLQADLGEMFSFGRLHAYNPFHGGFVRESTKWGTFKRFPKTRAMVMKVSVPEEDYWAMELRLSEMYENRKQYHYNFSGVLAAAFHKCLRRKNCYYCSEFVRDFIVEFGLATRDTFQDIVKPMDFLKEFSDKIIYRGELRAFEQKAVEIE